MGFLDKLKSIFFGSDYDKVVRNLSKRISELNDEKGKADVELESLEKKIIKIPSFEIKQLEAKKIKVKPFTSPTPRPVRTMKDLMQKRKEEEVERRQQLQQQVAKNLDTARIFINDENPDSAEELLFRTSSALQELKDNQLNNLYEELLNDIKGLKDILRQKEIERLEAEDRQKAEEEKRKRDQDCLRRQREEEERQERKRQAREYEEKLVREEEARRLEIDRLTTLVTRTKGDANKILQYLRMKGITRFYHFTDRQNLIRIKQLGGLYSWYYCEQNGIEIPNPGGDYDSRRYDIRHGLQDYVRLSFCDDHPMAWRKHKEGSSLLLLYIDINVATFKDTLFTDRNAASSSFACGGNYDDLMKINIQATQRNYVSRNEGEIFFQHQAECMIKTFIPLRYITNIDNPRKMIFG